MLKSSERRFGGKIWVLLISKNLCSGIVDVEKFDMAYED